MNFTEYRSKSLKELRPVLLEDYCINFDNVCRMQKFSTREIDDICAVNWKNENPIAVCISTLVSYVLDDVWKFDS